MYENAPYEAARENESPCILCHSWDKKLVLVDLCTADLLPGDTLRDKIGTQLMESLPGECDRLARSLNYLSRNALGIEMISDEIKDAWLRDHLGMEVELALYRRATICNPWQSCLERQTRRIYGLMSPREAETPRETKSES